MPAEYTTAPDGLGFGGNTVIIGGEPRIYLTLNFAGGISFSAWISITQAQALAAHISKLARKEPERV